MLDDEPVNPGFFESKTDELKKATFKKNAQLPTNKEDIENIDVIQRFLRIGVDKDKMSKLYEEALVALEEEPEEEELLIKAIKNYSKEKKA